jgi:predicted phage tail protein
MAIGMADISGPLTRILLHGPLGDKFGREVSLRVWGPGEAIRALCAVKKGFREELVRPGAHYSILLGDGAGGGVPLKALALKTHGADIHIVPAVAGASNSAIGNVIIGSAIFAASYAMLGPLGMVTGKFMTGLVTGIGNTGIAMAIGGAYQIISPAPKPPKNSGERPEHSPSQYFSGPVNTTAQNHPIQICYGKIEIGSAILATMMDNEDTLRVGAGGGGGGGGPHVPVPEEMSENTTPDPNGRGTHHDELNEHILV